jgi:hypothetical protein
LPSLFEGKGNSCSRLDCSTDINEINTQLITPIVIAPLDTNCNR